MKILICGSGGLGCEYARLLISPEILCQFESLELILIDPDVVSNTNLPRSKIFSESSVGQPKVRVLAEYVRNRAPHVSVTPIETNIQEVDEAILTDIDYFLGGLDSLNARRYLNAVLFSISTKEFTPMLIDGGCEGIRGHVCIVNPHTHHTCIECRTSFWLPVRFDIVSCAHFIQNPDSDEIVSISANTVSIVAGLVVSQLLNHLFEKPEIRSQFIFYIPTGELIHTYEDDPVPNTVASEMCYICQNGARVIRL